MTEPPLPGHPAEPSSRPAHTRARPTRRELLLGTGIGLGGLGLGALTGFIGGRNTTPSAGTGTNAPNDSGNAPETAGAGTQNTQVPPTGPTQAGVARPATPQHHALYVVADFDTTNVTETLATLGSAIITLASTADPHLFPDGTGDLTTLVAIGQRALQATTHGAELAPLLDMPAFTGDDAIPAQCNGGDLLLILAATDPGVLEPALQVLTAAVPGYSLRWIEHGFRGPGSDTVTRNPFGYHDGIIVPRSEEALDTNVWINNGPLTGATTCVVRRYTLNTTAFQALPTAEQNAIVGREKTTGAPLSGGALRDEADIAAKHPDGTLVIPATAHVRAAHPSFTGSDLMLRRSYSFITPTPPVAAPVSEPQPLTHGMLFTAFQRELRTFTRTQQRLDEVDALLPFTQQTASGAFMILPGFTAEHPLGAALNSRPER